MCVKENENSMKPNICNLLETKVASFKKLEMAKMK